MIRDENLLVFRWHEKNDHSSMKANRQPVSHHLENSYDIVTTPPDARAISLPPPCMFTQFVVVQDYNSGTAPFPYATECTATITLGTCDPATLIAEMNSPSRADPVVLGVTPSDADADAIELVSRSTELSEFPRGAQKQKTMQPAACSKLTHNLCPRR